MEENSKNKKWSFIISEKNIAVIWPNKVDKDLFASAEPSELTLNRAVYIKNQFSPTMDLIFAPYTLSLFPFVTSSKNLHKPWTWEPTLA